MNCVCWLDRYNQISTRECADGRYDGVSDPTEFTCDGWAAECFDCLHFREEEGRMYPISGNHEEVKCVDCQYNCERRFDEHMFYESTLVYCGAIGRHTYESTWWIPDMKCIDPSKRIKKIKAQEEKKRQEDSGSSGRTEYETTVMLIRPRKVDE